MAVHLLYTTNLPGLSYQGADRWLSIYCKQQTYLVYPVRVQIDGCPSTVHNKLTWSILSGCIEMAVRLLYTTNLPGLSCQGAGRWLFVRCTQQTYLVYPIRVQIDGYPSTVHNKLTWSILSGCR